MIATRPVLAEGPTVGGRLRPSIGTGSQTGDSLPPRSIADCAVVTTPEDLRDELRELARQARAWVEWIADSGVDELPRAPRQATAAQQPSRVEQPPAAAPPRQAVTVSTDAARHPPVEPAAKPRRAPPAAPSESPAAKAASPQVDVPDTAAARAARLTKLETEVSRCTRCKLHETRTNTVFARGSGTAELVFVGEGPGADEDATGVAFVGKAGKLLDRMVMAMGYGRDDVYICNVVKCRPPRNRKPEPDEIAACLPYLKEQLALLAPKAIVCLGATGVQALLGASVGITRMRGTWKLYGGRIPLMPTFHPAYLLRQPEKKRDVWNDLQQVMKRLGLEAPSKQRGDGGNGD